MRTVALAVLLVVLASFGALVVIANWNAPSVPPVDQTLDWAYDVGLEAMRAGDHETALELLRRVPEDHPQHAKAMRYVGWNILARSGRPKDGIAYVNRSLLENPFDGNVWQDAYRIYLESAFPSLR
jgi:hypothetical protein